jgi:hypothetical protein
MRLPELDQEAIEVRPFPRPHFCKEFPEVEELERYMNRDLVKIPTLGCDDLECRGDPFYIARSGLESHIPEFCRFREVDRSRVRVVYERW